MDGFIKITEDVINENEPIEIRNMLAKDVDECITANVSNFELRLLYSLIDCESPIEQSLSMGFEIYIYNPYIKDLTVIKQKDIIANGKKYRADFLIVVNYKRKNGVEPKLFVIECDGYEWHQKSKQQVEKDNIRTRDLQKSGYEVIKFSGTEIYHRCDDCVKEIISIIIEKGGEHLG